MQGPDRTAGRCSQGARRSLRQRRMRRCCTSGATRQAPLSRRKYGRPPSRGQGDAEQNGHIRSDDGADSLNHLAGKAGAVFRRAAVLIGAVVKDLGHKLVYEIACVSMDLYSVKACVTRNACCIFEGLLEFFDLLNGHCASQNVGSEECGLLAGRTSLSPNSLG